MSRFTRWLNKPQAKSPQVQARIGSQFEPLEQRALMSSTPLPVLLVVADQQDFYFREYSETRLAIESKGVPVVIGATTTQPSTPHWGTGQALGTSGTIVPDVALAGVDVNEYSAIAFVGGWGSSMYQYAYNDPNGDGITDNYYSHGFYNGDDNLNDGVIAPQKVAVNNLINSFLDADKPVAAICHGTTVLAWARVDGVSPLAGKFVAVPHNVGTPDQFFNSLPRSGGYNTGQYDQALFNGAIPTSYAGAYGNPGSQDDVIVDGLIITGENPDSSTLFGVRIAEQVLASVNQLPVASDQSWQLAENAPANTVVGVVTATDANAGQTVSYAIVSGNTGGAFAIDPVTGAVTVANPAAIDFEANPVFNLRVAATDNAHIPGMTEFAVNITLENQPETPINVVNDLVIQGTPENDTMYIWSSANNTVSYWINGQMTVNQPVPEGGRVIVQGYEGNDRIFATDLCRGVTIHGGDGHDLITGGHGNDIIDGGAGVDRIDGMGGNDILLGGDGDDHLFGSDGHDIILGGLGNDRIEGGDGGDLLIGGLGVDVLRGGSGDDILIGGQTGYAQDTSALSLMHSNWQQNAPIENRIASISIPTIADNDVDHLVGDAGQDWVFVTPNDTVYLTESDDHHTAV